MSMTIELTDSPGLILRSAPKVRVSKDGAALALRDGRSRALFRVRAGQARSALFMTSEEVS